LTEKLNNCNLCEINESKFRITLTLFLCKKCIDGIKNVNPLKLYTLLFGSKMKIEIEEIKNGG